MTEQTTMQEQKPVELPVKKKGRPVGSKNRKKHDGFVTADKYIPAQEVIKDGENRGTETNSSGTENSNAAN